MVVLLLVVLTKLRGAGLAYEPKYGELLLAEDPIVLLQTREVATHPQAKVLAFGYLADSVQNATIFLKMTDFSAQVPFLAA